MLKRICDKCGTDNKVDEFSIPTGTQVDSPSGRTEEVMTNIDLCLSCAGGVYQTLYHLLKKNQIQDSSFYERAASLMKELKTLKPKQQRLG